MAETDELYGVLCAHAARYPLMRPTDAVKLIYQGEFGSGHMIKNEAAALDRLRAEYAQIIHDETMPLYEYIGCGIARVNLAALDTNVLPLERLNAAICRRGERSAWQHGRF